MHGDLSLSNGVEIGIIEVPLRMIHGLVEEISLILVSMGLELTGSEGRDWRFLGPASQPVEDFPAFVRGCCH